MDLSSPAPDRPEGRELLRVARAAASGGVYAPQEDTLQLMREQAVSGALERLAPAQLWQELSAGLMTPRPALFLGLLRECGALKRVLPEVQALFGVPLIADDPPTVDIGLHQLRLLDATARCGAPLAVRWAALAHKLGMGGTPREIWPSHYKHEQRGEAALQALAPRLAMPDEVLDLALLAVRECDRVHRASDMRAGAIAALLERVDAFARPERFERLLTVCTCDFAAYGRRAEDYPKAPRLRRALQACLEIEPELAPADAGNDAAAQAERRLEARAQAVARALRSGCSR